MSSRTELGQETVVEAAQVCGQAGLIGPGSRWLAFGVPDLDLVAASDGGRALADERGWTRADHPVLTRLRAFALRPAGRPAMILERMRLGGPASAGPAIVSFSRLDLQGQRLVLMVVDPARPLARRQADAGARMPSVVAESGEKLPERPIRAVVAPNRRSRFVWRTDAEGRLASHSGPDGRASPPSLEGRPWADVVTGEAATALAGRQPFSALPATWQGAPQIIAVPVVLSGAPIIVGGQFTGFRGFALYASDDVSRHEVRTIEEPAALPPPEEVVANIDIPAEPAPPHEEVAGISDTGRRPARSWGGASLAPPFVLMPVFQAIMDASLSGLSDLIAAIPQPREQKRPTSNAPVEAGSVSREAHPPEEDTQGDDTRGDPSPDPGPLPPSDAAPAASASVLPEVMDEAETPPLPALPSGEDQGPVLTSAERGALSEIARALGARLDERTSVGDGTADGQPRETATLLAMPAGRGRDGAVRQFLDPLRLPAVVHARGQPLFANACFLELVGAADLASVPASGGAAELMGSGEQGEGQGEPSGAEARPRQALVAGTPVESVSVPIDWQGRRASLTLVWRARESGVPERAASLEVELARRDERVADLQAFLDIAPAGVVKLDAAGRIVAMSRVAETMFGHAENEVAGEQISVLFAPESRAEAFALADRARIGGEPPSPPQALRAVRRDGASLDLGATARRIGPDVAGSVVVALADLSGERRIEASLTRARHDLASAHRLSSEVLARVGHDIRSPLTAIIGFADLLLEERLGPLADARLRPYLEGIRSSGLAVIDRVGQFSRYADAVSGRISVPPSDCDLNALITRAVSDINPTLVRQRVVLRTSFARNLPLAWIDHPSVLQAVSHLLSGILAMTPPGGHIIVSTASPDGAKPTISVRGKDCVLSGRELDVALDPFGAERDDLSTSRTGLDLAFAKALIGANYGRLTGTKTAADGVLFELALPAAKTRDEPKLAPAGDRRGELHVLRRG